MKLNVVKLCSLVVSACAILLSVNISAQTYVRYVAPSDIGTKALYSDSVLPSIQLPHGVSRVDNNISVQNAALELSEVLRNRNMKLLSVYVCGSSSPDGLWQDNVNLSRARTDAAVKYLRYVTGIPYDKICSESLNEDWDRLYELVQKSDTPYRDEILDIISTKKWGERKKALQKLADGKAWRILLDEFFPQLRCVRIAFFCQWDQKKPGSPVKAQVDTVYVRDTVYCVQETVVVSEKPQPELESELPVVDVYEKYHDTPWMMGVKTNLVGDGMAVPTLGMEFQIGKHLSLDIQGMYSGWNIFNPADKNTNIYGVSPEIRLWPGKMPMQKGSFFGVHARVVWYTLQWTDGLLYQNGPKDVWEGDFHNAGNSTPAWALGLTYGYSIGFGRKNNWGLELMLGIGYASYRQNVAEYNSGAWSLVKHQDKHHLGLTRAGINLTYKFSVRKVNPSYYDKE